MALKIINKQVLFVDKCFEIERLEPYIISGKFPNYFPRYSKANLLYNITFPSDYPFSPPIFQFTMPFLHPNFNNVGMLDLSILNKDWCPAITIDMLLYTILSILDDPIYPESNSCKFSDEFAAEMWNDIKFFNEYFDEMLKDFNNSLEQ